MRNGPKGAPIKAFPPGLRVSSLLLEAKTYSDMVSFRCSPETRTGGRSMHRAMRIRLSRSSARVCLSIHTPQCTALTLRVDFSGAHDSDPDWAERPNFFDHSCPDGMRAQVFFPSCWDGVNLDSLDHKSHMSYPIQNFNGGDCPDSHPVQLVSLFYEMLVPVDRFDYTGPATWVLANGDTTGYGHHGDFQNGWDVDLLQDAIDNCPNANGNVMNCPPLARIFDQASADACVLETQIVDEPAGFTSPITTLPGCNPLWDGTGPRPTCPNQPTPALVPAQTPLPAGWTEIGCIAEGTNGRALTGASMTSPGMTRAACANFCASKNFTLAGVEFSDECYCDNQMRNGAAGSTVTWNECSNTCAGNGECHKLTHRLPTNFSHE